MRIFKPTNKKKLYQEADQAPILTLNDFITTHTMNLHSTLTLSFKLCKIALTLIFIQGTEKNLIQGEDDYFITRTKCSIKTLK